MTKAMLKKSFIGFDGFTDEIVTAVAERLSHDTFTSLPSIESFGKKILAAKNHSGNIELITREVKLGGNAPIMANAMLELGSPVILAATIGHFEAVEPLFHTLADRCDLVFPLGSSGYSEAIEFEDGKIILGKMLSLIDLSYQTLISKIGKDSLIQALNSSSLFASTNWTMIPHMTEIWKCLLREIIPHLSPAKRWMFVDLADPAKRSDADLLDALATLQEFQKVFQVILGLNLAEAQRLAQVLQLHENNLAQRLQERTGLDQIVVHDKHKAVAASVTGLHEQKSFYTKQPLLSTGAGDNFNAGYCSALLQELSIPECLIQAVGTSSYYVRYGKSPNQQDLQVFISQNLTDQP